MGLKEMTLMYEKSDLPKSLDRLRSNYHIYVLHHCSSPFYINLDSIIFGIDEQLNIEFKQILSIPLTKFL